MESRDCVQNEASSQKVEKQPPPKHGKTNETATSKTENSLTSDSSPETSKKIQEEPIETVTSGSELKVPADDEYSDCQSALEVADSARLKGNQAYSSGRLHDAISIYSVADRHLSNANKLEAGQ
jgi:hypothetical protein